MKLATLRKQARAAAKWRGHDLKRFFHPYPTYRSNVQVAYCKHCDAQVAVNSAPWANEIDVGGNAVAVNCPVMPLRASGETK